MTHIVPSPKKKTRRWDVTSMQEGNLHGASPAATDFLLAPRGAQQPSQETAQVTPSITIGDDDYLYKPLADPSPVPKDLPPFVEEDYYATLGSDFNLDGLETSTGQEVTAPGIEKVTSIQVNEDQRTLPEIRWKNKAARTPSASAPERMAKRGMLMKFVEESTTLVERAKKLEKKASVKLREFISDGYVPPAFKKPKLDLPLDEGDPCSGFRVNLVKAGIREIQAGMKEEPINKTHMARKIEFHLGLWVSAYKGTLPEDLVSAVEVLKSMEHRFSGKPDKDGFEERTLKRVDEEFRPKLLKMVAFHKEASKELENISAKMIEFTHAVSDINTIYEEHKKKVAQAEAVLQGLKEAEFAIFS